MNNYSIFESWNRLEKRMREKHPDATSFGDSMAFDGEKIVSHKCQLCGEELVKEDKNDKD